MIVCDWERGECACHSLYVEVRGPSVYVEESVLSSHYTGPGEMEARSAGLWAGTLTRAMDS